MGAMEEVRELLAGGASSGQVIAQGYAPGTVYKVQRLLRRQEAKNSVGQRIVCAQRLSDLGEDTRPSKEMEEQMQALESKVAEAEEVRQKLLGRNYSLGWANIDGTTWQTLWDGPSPSDSLSTPVHWLEVESDEMRTRVEKAEASSEKERTARFEAERQAESLRKELGGKVKDLEVKLRSASDAHAQMSQSATWAQRQLDEEKEARAKAERQWQLWADKATDLERSNQRLTQTTATLEPLRVWSGYPCKVCKKPMSGVVDRELAAKLQEDLAHVTCIKKGGTPWAPLAIGGAILYGLSRRQ